MTELYVVTTVCTGNICRSPLAQALLQKHLAQAGVLNVDVQSAGVAAPEGQQATAAMQTVAESLGVDLSGHRSQPLALPLLHSTDLVLCASAAHKRTVASRWPHMTERKLALFQDAVPGAEGHDVADPYGLSQGDYELAGALIDRAMEAWAARLVELLAR